MKLSLFLKLKEKYANKINSFGEMHALGKIYTYRRVSEKILSTAIFDHCKKHRKQIRRKCYENWSLF